MTPREIAVIGAYLPTVLPLFAVGGVATWLIDRLLARSGLYRQVWHPSLFRASLLVCICGGLGLMVYR
jgi:protein AaeX